MRGQELIVRLHCPLQGFSFSSKVVLKDSQAGWFSCGLSGDDKNNPAIRGSAVSSPFG